jgi:hypothetical protein
VGFGTPLSLVIGLILISGGLVLFFLGNFRPDIKKDSDNIYAVLAILAGILGVVSFNKEIVPSLEQLLLAGMGIFLMWENINNRTPNPDARRSFDNRREEERSARRPSYRADRVNEYEEFNPPRGSAGLRGEYQDAGYGSNSDYRGDRSLPRRDERDNDRSRRDRPNRSDRFDNYGNERPDDRFGGAPRQLTDRNDRPERNPGSDRFERPSRDDAPRRRNPDERPPRRRPDRVEDINSDVIDDIPAADYTDFTPVESTDRGNSGSSWGPQD